jgi:hypothetical protein
VARTVISKLDVWDSAGVLAARLQPGTIVDCCRIRRGIAAVEGCGQVYVMEFEWSGAQYHCPLVSFQSRTLAIDTSQADENPARDAVAI